MTNKTSCAPNNNRKGKQRKKTEQNSQAEQDKKPDKINKVKELNFAVSSISNLYLVILNGLHTINTNKQHGNSNRKMQVK